MNLRDLRCWFEEFGIRGLGIIRSTSNTVTLEFADLTEILIAEAPYGRCNVTVWRGGQFIDRRDGLDLPGLLGLLRGEGKEVRP